MAKIGTNWEEYRDKLDGISDEDWNKIANERNLTIGDVISPKEREALRRLLKYDKSFSEEERFILSELLGFRPTLDMVGKAVGISKVAVKKIEDKAMAKLKKQDAVKKSMDKHAADIEAQKLATAKELAAKKGTL